MKSATLTTWGRAAVAALPLWAACAAGAGVVETAGGRLEGNVELGEKFISVAGRKVAWADVSCAVIDGKVRALPGPHVVRLRGGDVWVSRILSLTAGRLSLRIEPFGGRSVEAGQVAEMEFSANLPPDGTLKPQSLYRAGQQPVPGALLWITSERLAVDSPFGALTLQRAGTLRYVFAPLGAPPARGEADEVVLVNGSVLRGRLSGADGGVKLLHALLGELVVPATALRTIVKPGKSAALLTDLPATVRAASLIGGAQRPGAVRQIAACEDGEGLAFAKALRIEPATAVRYSLPSRGGPVRFRGVLAMAGGSRSAVSVRIASGGRELVKQELRPGGTAVPVAADVPGGVELSIEVDFAGRMDWPCAVLVADPVVFFLSAGGG